MAFRIHDQSALFEDFEKIMINAPYLGTSCMTEDPEYRYYFLYRVQMLFLHRVQVLFPLQKAQTQNTFYNKNSTTKTSNIKGQWFYVSPISDYYSIFCLILAFGSNGSKDLFKIYISGYNGQQPVLLYKNLKR